MRLSLCNSVPRTVREMRPRRIINNLKQLGKLQIPEVKTTNGSYLEILQADIVIHNKIPAETMST